MVRTHAETPGECDLENGYEMWYKGEAATGTKGCADYATTQLHLRFRKARDTKFKRTGNENFSICKIEEGTSGKCLVDQDITQFPR